MSTGPGDALIEGTNGKDVLYGAWGKNELRGYGGNDKLFAGDGKDKLIGGEGDDQLTGDGGGSFADSFIFGRNSGKDVVTDFQVDKDVLVIRKGINGINKASDVLDHAAQKGKNVVIDLGDGNKITLKNIDLDDLKKSPDDHFDVIKM